MYGHSQQEWQWNVHVMAVWKLLTVEALAVITEKKKHTPNHRCSWISKKNEREGKSYGTSLTQKWGHSLLLFLILPQLFTTIISLGECLGLPKSFDTFVPGWPNSWVDLEYVLLTFHFCSGYVSKLFSPTFFLPTGPYLWLCTSL